MFVFWSERLEGYREYAQGTPWMSQENSGGTDTILSELRKLTQTLVAPLPPGRNRIIFAGKASGVGTLLGNFAMPIGPCP